MIVEISKSLAEELLILFASSKVNIMSNGCRKFKEKLENEVK